MTDRTANRFFCEESKTGGKDDVKVFFGVHGSIEMLLTQREESLEPVLEYNSA